MADPHSPPLSSFSFSDEEKAAIELALQQKDPWDEKDPKLKGVKDCLISLKGRLRELHMERQGETCCYCKTNLSGGESFMIDREHILPKAKFKELTYEPFNLSVSCKRCNMSYKGQRTDFAVKQLIETGEHYEESNGYQFVHPNLDRWTDHLTRIMAQVDESVLVKYLIKDESKKGAYTHNYFRFDRLEVQIFDEAQGAKKLSEAAMEQKQSLEKILGGDLP